MEKDILYQLNSKAISTYERHITLNMIKKIKTYIKKINHNSFFYKGLSQIYHCIKHIQTYGVWNTFPKTYNYIKMVYQTVDLPPKNNMRVLFVASDNNRTSGAFLSMVTLNKLLRKEYNVDTFVVLPNKGNGESLLIENHIPYTLIESRDWVVSINQKRSCDFDKMVKKKKKINKIAIRAIEKIIIQNHFDLLHINTTYSYVGAIAAQKAGIPYIWHLREFLEEDQGNTLWDRNKGNCLIGQATNVIAISKSIYRKYENIIPNSKLVCILNGVDETKFYKPEKKILQNDTVKLVFIGGFELYKGHIEFANACKKIYDSGIKNFEIYFIGTGKKEVQEKVKGILSEGGLIDCVHYLGYRHDVNAYLEQTDISFTCSRSEAFGRTTVEAMLSGNLVIGANTAGTRELIQDGKTGLLYVQGNSDDLADKIIFAINNRDTAKKIAKEGRKYMFENMTAKINAHKIYSLYQSILSKKIV